MEIIRRIAKPMKHMQLFWQRKSHCSKTRTAHGGVKKVLPMTNTSQRVYSIAHSGFLLMEIPPELVLSSALVESSIKHQAEESLARHYPNFVSHLPEFCLFLLVLQEKTKRNGSFWYLYIELLPKEIGSSIFWDKAERDYASRLPLKTMLERMDTKLKVFQNTLQDILSDHDYNDELIKWAFAIVHSRCWVASYPDSNGDSVMNIVCFGDMFNHRFNGTVTPLQGSVNDTVCMISQETADGDAYNDEYFMNYGTEWLAARFPVVYGFCDTSLPMLPATTIVNRFLSLSNEEVKEKAKAMGFTDYEAMGFSTQNGGISDLLFDAILYLVILDKLDNSVNPSDIIAAADDMKIVETVFTSNCTNIEALDDMHQKYLRKVLVYLYKEVNDFISEIGPIPEVDEEFLGQHPHWKMISEYHQLFLGVYQKVRQNIEQIFAARCM